MMKFKQLDDLIRSEVLAHPLSQAEFGGDELEYFNLHKVRIYKVLQIVPETAQKDVLEIGCEPGYIAIVLTMMGYNVRGVGVNLTKDFNKRMDRFRIPIDVCNLDIDDLPWEDEQFDIVIFSEVIEHLFCNVPHALDEINRVLRRDGFLILTTPNLARFSNRVRLLWGKSINPNLGGEKPFFQRDIYKRHNREYTLEELIYLLERSGLKINQRFYWNYPASTYERPPIKKIVNFVSAFLPKFRDVIFICAKKISVAGYKG